MPITDPELFRMCLLQAVYAPDLLEEFDRLTGYDLCMRRSQLEQEIDKASGFLDAGIKAFVEFVTTCIYAHVQEKVDMAAKKLFCTTYCNQLHRLSDGKPVGHECFILPTAALHAEKNGEVAQACEILQQWKKRTKHKGLKTT